MEDAAPQDKPARSPAPAAMTTGAHISAGRKPRLSSP